MKNSNLVVSPWSFAPAEDIASSSTSLINTMASSGFENPNDYVMNNDDDRRQVMSPRGAPTTSDRPATPRAVLNGVSVHPNHGVLNMDGETITMPSSSTAHDDTSGGARNPALSENPPPEAPQSVRETMSSSSARGFLMGPQATVSDGVRAEGVDNRNRTSFFTGVAKAVQSIPAAVEGLVLRHGQSDGSGHDGPPAEAEGFASAQSGSPEGLRRSQSGIRAAGTPLLDEDTLQRLNGLQASAPHLYVPEAPSSGVRPPSTTSSDIQAEVRKQVREFMLIRDEENRELRTRVELLMTENRILRHEISNQMYTRDPNARTVSSGRFAGLEWIGRGFGNLMSGVSSPKPISPPDRPVDLRPPPAPPSNHAPQPPRMLPPPSGDGASGPGFKAAGYPSASCPPVPEEIPLARALDFESNGQQALKPGEAAENSGRGATDDPMSVVLTGMAQLQGVVADLAGSPKQARQEVIKPGVNSLPDLPARRP